MVFTGIVQEVGEAKFDLKKNLLSVVPTTVSPATFWAQSNAGDSVAVNGVCLTLLSKPNEADNFAATFFVMEETRSKTTFGRGPDVEDGSSFTVAVNLEHALRVGDSMGGHTVTGHVDGVAEVSRVTPHPDGSRDVWVDLKDLPKLVVHKGSITLDGVSLTVAEIQEGKLVRVSLIPHTLSHTTLQYRKAGDSINVEFDQALKLRGGDGGQLAPSSSGWVAPQSVTTTMRSREELDSEFMRQAIALGEKEGRVSAPPNPWVSSLLVGPGDVILGKGVHVKAGESHAEVLAIRDAESKLGDLADIFPKSTLYVTLEPCHHHGRTPPCDALVVSKKIGRVVVAVLDSDERVKGQGVALLRESGMEVVVGVEEALAKQSLAPYLHQRVTGRPYVVAKVAISIDSKIACRDGTSQWITGEASREDAHRLRAESQAIIVGSRTALLDRPRLTVRLGNGAATAKPLRVLLDSRGALLTEDHPLLDLSLAPTTVFTTSKSRDTEARKLWERKRVEVVEVQSGAGDSVDLPTVLDDLGKRGILQVLVEGGAGVHGSFLLQELIQQLVVYQGPLILGDGNGDTVSWPPRDLRLQDGETISKARPWKLTDIRRFDNDVRTTYLM